MQQATHAAADGKRPRSYYLIERDQTDQLPYHLRVLRKTGQRHWDQYSAMEIDRLYLYASYILNSLRNVLLWNHEYILAIVLLDRCFDRCYLHKKYYQKRYPF